MSNELHATDQTARDAIAECKRRLDTLEGRDAELMARVAKLDAVFERLDKLEQRRFNPYPGAQSEFMAAAPPDEQHDTWDKIRPRAAPHCAEHDQFEYDCIECADTIGSHRPTPGPWTVADTDSGNIVTDQQGHSVAAIHYTQPGHRANAHLIAAAPDMLAALKDAARQIPGARLPCVLAAIRKAEGK